jgi:hypothetical protein
LQPVEPRFWAKVDKGDGTGCWLWTAAKVGNGYGAFFPRHGVQVYAHRIAYELLVGPIPKGLEIDHLCRVPLCVKAIADEHGPTHLEVVTRQENQRRAALANLQTHCPKGHPRDEIPRQDRCPTCRVEYLREWRQLRAARFRWNVARNVIAVMPDPEREGSDG